MTDERKCLCLECSKDFSTCDGKILVFGIDGDPSARGAEADIVLECDAYVPHIKPVKAQT